VDVGFDVAAVEELEIDYCLRVFVVNGYLLQGYERVVGFPG